MYYQNQKKISVTQTERAVMPKPSAKKKIAEVKITPSEARVLSLGRGPARRPPEDDEEASLFWAANEARKARARAERLKTATETESFYVDAEGKAIGFKPGHHIGRPKGSGSAINRDLRKGLVEAAVMHGYDGKGEGGLTGYLFLLAEKQQRTFGGLLGKLMPLQLSGNVGLGIASIQVSSVPTDRYLSAEEAQAKVIDQVALDVSQAVIEHVAEAEAEEEEDEEEDA